MSDCLFKDICPLSTVAQATYLPLSPFISFQKRAFSPVGMLHGASETAWHVSSIITSDAPGYIPTGGGNRAQNVTKGSVCAAKCHGKNVRVFCQTRRAAVAFGASARAENVVFGAKGTCFELQKSTYCIAKHATSHRNMPHFAV